MRHIESQHQIALFRWADLAAKQYPELALLYAIPSGGYRRKPEAALLKAQGARAGVPDTVLPCPKKGLGACYIELKRPAAPGVAKGTVSPAQRAMLAALEAAGNRVAVAYGWEEAKAVLLDYLS